MEPVSILLAALAAGALAAATDTASQAVKDAYAGFKALVQKHFVDKASAKTALAEYEKDADTWEKPLQKALIEAGVDKDEAIIQRAQQVLKLTNPQQTAEGKYNVQIGEAKGTVIGDNAHVTQHFGKE